MLLPLASAQPPIDIDAKDNNKEKEEVEDNNAEEPPKPLVVVRFISV